MQINPIKLSSLDDLIKDYRSNKNDIMHYFDYKPFNEFEKRVHDLKQRDFNREELTEVLYTLNQRWGAPKPTIKNIARLTDPKSVVVIGGQQAGLMTGPLYTVNKIISIIQLANQQSEALDIPVIPVFWIAGEDHDYDEINHNYVLEAAGMVQHKTEHQILQKTSISEIPIDELKTKKWLKAIFTQLLETIHTKELYETVNTCLVKSKTYVDFFARLIFQLFKEDGLVLMDSGDELIREIEKDYFVKMIKHQPEISASVHKDYQKISQAGYSVMLDVESQDTHLFYQQNNERILLEIDDSGDWVGKQNEVKFTTSEMLEIAAKAPYLLSNNVVTRPLMQELLFPTLAFVGGNGEISYWAVLKSAFHVMGLKMPPVVPRLSFTYIDSTVQKIMVKFDLKSKDVLGNRIGEKKGRWLAAQHHPPLGVMIEQLKQTIDRAHLPLRHVSKGIRSDLGDLANKNLDYLFREIEHLERNITKALQEKYNHELAEFDLVDNTLNPFGGLQERIWNPLPFLNHYGIDFFEQFSKKVCDFEEEHFLVIL